MTKLLVYPSPLTGSVYPRHRQSNGGRLFLVEGCPFASHFCWPSSVYYQFSVVKKITFPNKLLYPYPLFDINRFSKFKGWTILINSFYLIINYIIFSLRGWLGKHYIYTEFEHSLTFKNIRSPCIGCNWEQQNICFVICLFTFVAVVAHVARLNSNFISVTLY